MLDILSLLDITFFLLAALGAWSGSSSGPSRG